MKTDSSVQAAFKYNIFFLFCEQRPLSGSVEKKMKIFTSGKASVRATIDKKGYMQGNWHHYTMHANNYMTFKLLFLIFHFVVRWETQGWNPYRKLFFSCSQAQI